MTTCNLACKAKAVAELLRLHNIIVSLVTTYIGYSTLATLNKHLPLIPPSPDYAIAAIIVTLIAGAGYAINDYFDIDIDRVNKPERPLPSGRIKPKTAYWLALSLFATGTIIAFAYAGILSGLYALLVSILLYYYSKTLKRRGFSGNLVVAFNSASTILYGGLVVSEKLGQLANLWVTLIPFTYAFLLVLGREVVKGIEDYYGDLKGRAMTLAVKYGPRRAASIALAMLIAVIALSPLPYLLGVYNMFYMLLAGIVDVLIAISIYHITIRPRNVNEIITYSGMSRRLLKWAFFVGGLAFILGVF